MSRKDQNHAHNWQRRVRDWLLVPMGGPGRQRPVTPDELAAHNAQAADMWMAVDGVVYSVSRFTPFHPGGTVLMQRHAGTDASEVYAKHHRSVTAAEVIGSCRIGPLVAAPGGVAGVAETAVGSAGTVPRGGALSAPPDPHKQKHPPARFAGHAITGGGLDVDGVVALAKQSDLFSHISDAQLRAAASAGHDLLPGYRGDVESTTTASASTSIQPPKGSAPSDPLGGDPEAEAEAIGAVFELLDKDGSGRVSVAAVAEMLVSIEGATDVGSALRLIQSLLAEQDQQGKGHRHAAGATKGPEEEDVRGAIGTRMLNRDEFIHLAQLFT